MANRFFTVDIEAPKFIKTGGDDLSVLLDAGSTKPISDFLQTKADVEAVLTGDITSHTHSYVGLTGNEDVAGIKSFTTSIEVEGISLQNASARSGLLEAGRLGTTTWSGYNIRYSTTSAFNFMANETNVGIYDDVNNDWILQATELGYVALYYSGNQKLITSSTGISIIGEIITTGGNSTDWNTAYTHSQITTGNPHSLDFTDLLTTPTTIAGYGITDKIAYTDVSNVFTVPQEIRVNNAGTDARQLLIHVGESTGDDANLEIRGARSNSTTSDTANIIFSNWDLNLADYNLFGKITGQQTNGTTNIGDLLFYSYANGTAKFEAARLVSDGTFKFNKINVTNSGNVADPLVLTRATQVGIQFAQTSYVRYLGNATGDLRWGTSDNHALNALVLTDVNFTSGTGATNWAAGNHTHAYLPLAGGIITGDVTFNDSKKLRFGTIGGEGSIYSNGIATYWDMGADKDLIIRDSTATRFTFDSSVGDFIATGTVSGDRIEAEYGSFAMQRMIAEPGVSYYLAYDPEVANNRPYLSHAMATGGAPYFQMGLSNSLFRIGAYADAETAYNVYIVGDSKFSGDVVVTGSAEIEGILLQDASARLGLLEFNKKTGASYVGINAKFSATASWSIMGHETVFGAYDETETEWIWRYTSNSELQLYYNGIEKFHTVSTGVNVIGTTETDALKVTNSTASTNTTSGAVIITGGVGIGGAVFAGGNMNAPDFVGTSDIRLKENIKEYKPRPIISSYKEFNFKKDKQERIGVIAQELEKHHPEFIRENGDGIKSVSYNDLHSAEIAYLKAEIEELKQLIREKL